MDHYQPIWLTNHSDYRHVVHHITHHGVEHSRAECQNCPPHGPLKKMYPAHLMFTAVWKLPAVTFVPNRACDFCSGNQLSECTFKPVVKNRLASVCLKTGVTSSVWECRGHVVDRQTAGFSDGLSVCPFQAMMCNIMSCRDELMAPRDVISSSRLAWCQYDLIFFFINSDSFTKVQVL